MFAFHQHNIEQEAHLKAVSVHHKYSYFSLCLLKLFCTAFNVIQRRQHICFIRMNRDCHPEGIPCWQLTAVLKSTQHTCSFCKTWKYSVQLQVPLSFSFLFFSCSVDHHACTQRLYLYMHTTISCFNNLSIVQANKDSEV